MHEPGFKQLSFILLNELDRLTIFRKASAPFLVVALALLFAAIWFDQSGLADARWSALIGLGILPLLIVAHTSRRAFWLLLALAVAIATDPHGTFFSVAPHIWVAGTVALALLWLIAPLYTGRIELAKSEILTAIDRLASQASGDGHLDLAKAYALVERLDRSVPIAKLRGVLAQGATGTRSQQYVRHNLTKILKEVRRELT